MKSNVNDFVTKVEIDSPCTFVAAIPFFFSSFVLDQSLGLTPTASLSL
jgi:hypothetical protein